MGQNETRPEKDYNCSQGELHAGLDIVWDSQAEHEAEFVAENTKYIAGLSVIRQTAIEDARDLPDGQGRGAEAEDLRVTLVEIHDVVIGKWNSLDGYVGKAFTGGHYKPRIEEAGKGHYAAAAAKNWEEVVELLQHGKHFMNAHTAVLTNDGGMPASFAGDYELARVAFKSTYKLFKDAQQDSQEETDKKILANNAIYKDGREMMEDGKRIFRKNASVKDRFVWERILELMGGGGGGTPPVTGSFAVVTNQTVLNPITLEFISRNAGGGEELGGDWGDGYDLTATMPSGTYTSVPHSYIVEGVYTITISDKPSAPGGVAAMGEIRILNGQVISITIPDNAWLRNITLSGNPIVTFSIPATQTGLMHLDLSGCALVVESTNGVLVTVNDYGTNNGYINLSGGTNAPPTGAGLTAKAALIARGWTVITN